MSKLQEKANLIKAELTNSKGVTFKMLENGSIFSMKHHDIMINQVLGSPVDGALGNIYIRRHFQTDISYFPVMGPGSDSEFHVGDGSVAWRGKRDGLAYTCTLKLAEDETAWFWTIRIQNTLDQPQILDVIFTQDLGIASEGAVRNNELYTSQYIDHTVFEDRECGYVICSRQNQAQGIQFPWIMHGCFHKVAGYITDGFQFFGLDYKETNVPAALKKPEFPNTRYQYEFAFPALQTEKIEVPAQGSTEVVFFAVYESDHPQATSEQDLEKIKTADKAHKQAANHIDKNHHFTSVPKTSSVFNTSPVFAAQDLTDQELERYFGSERRHEERQGQTLLSFFYGPEYHVVLKAKERFAERPHGHILRSGQDLLPSEDILSVTSWIYGVFNSHITIGNTNFNKILTVSRNPLNVLKSSGQRIFVKTTQGFELLGMPSAFEMGLNGARWIYKGQDAAIIVRTWTSLENPACFMEISVEGTGKLEFLISNNIVLGDKEFDAGGQVVIDKERKRIELIPASEELAAKKYPEARYFIVSKDTDRIERIGGDGLLFADGKDRHHAYVTLQTKPVSRFALAFTGNVLSASRAEELADHYSNQLPSYEAVQLASGAYWDSLSKQAKLSMESEAEEAAKLNDILRWYLHNAMVHYTTPHGLEQYSGAAWGLRDVCQGPVEFLLATRNFDPLRVILKKIYAHQFVQTGDWPQWFMFDRFQEIQAPDSHADIIIWPLKALCEYIEATDDLSVLDESVTFTDFDNKKFTEATATLFEHTLKQIDKIEQDCIPGTALVSFGHGDWEDTLQPADSAMRERLVSTWTVELIYQTLGRYRNICVRSGKPETADRLTAFCDKIKEDFCHYLVKDEVAAGLVYFKPEGIEYLLHPSDEKTGVQYRLLPMTRGMISGLFTSEQMRNHLSIIQENLLFPDGVRLMNRPMTYHGGTERYFKRAESAANFGREIGLQYTHAHIRYIEAMAKIGRTEEVYQGLLTIIPISIDQVVPFALPRQSNAYFSSSDADFSDRYEAREHFDRIKTHEVGIKGGWRIYSSGPGIFLGQLILNFLGLRELFSDVLLDPVMPKKLNGLTFDFEYDGKKVRYLYHVAGEGFSPRQVVINGAAVREKRYADNPYRRGGMLIPKAEFIEALNRNENLVEIYI